jgi:hypothetical protein
MSPEHMKVAISNREAISTGGIVEISVLKCKIKK